MIVAQNLKIEKLQKTEKYKNSIFTFLKIQILKKNVILHMIVERMSHGRCCGSLWVLKLFLHVFFYYFEMTNDQFRNISIALVDRVVKVNARF